MRLLDRLRTVLALIAHFARPNRFFLLPLLFILLVSGMLLLLTGGLSYVAPFWYAIF
jgi:predicted FMN-binding regulatory protein PaiB